MSKGIKITLVGAGVLGLAGLTWLGYSLLNNKNGGPTFNLPFREIPDNTTPNTPNTQPSTHHTQPSPTASGFPLKMNSRGPLVEALQKALIKAGGAAILPKWGVDGHIGNETISALRKLGHPETISLDTFVSIVGIHPTTIASSGTTPSKLTLNEELVLNLHKTTKILLYAPLTKILPLIRDVEHYKTLNKMFIKERSHGEFKTIGKALTVFFKKSIQTAFIQKEFKRIGLRFDLPSRSWIA